ncbi:hypothetical protein VTK26DRAFT_8196 [Humicola hyalothermophila]
MDALHLKVDSIGDEVGQIREVLRGYLEHGIVKDRKVQPPKTKAGRDLLQHLLGRLDEVSTGLVNVSQLAASHPSPSPPAARGPDTPSSNAAAPSLIPQQSLPPDRQVGTQTFQNDNSTGREAGSSAPAAVADHFRLKDGSVYRNPIPCEGASPLFDCTYQDIHVLNEELFELYSSHPVVRELGYFKLQVRDLPPLRVQKVARPGKDHATSFCYKTDRLGLVKVDTGKRCKFTSPQLPLPVSAKTHWSLREQQDLWNSSAADPPKGSWPYIIGNPLFDDVELSPGEKLRRRGRTTLEGINTQYVYFNLAGKTITTMHREDAHVRSENLLRSGQHKFWCFIKPAFAKKLEERMALEYPEMRRCSQAVRHLSRNIPPARLDEWGIEYTLDYCVPGQAVVTEPGTYHQVLNLGPNYALAINLEYSSSPDMPPDYRFCDKFCPDKFAISADDFRIYDRPPLPEEQDLPPTPETVGAQENHAKDPGLEDVSPLRIEPAVIQVTQSATPPPEQPASHKHEATTSQGRLAQVQSPNQCAPDQTSQQISQSAVGATSSSPTAGSVSMPTPPLHQGHDMREPQRPSTLMPPAPLQGGIFTPEVRSNDHSHSPSQPLEPVSTIEQLRPKAVLVTSSAGDSPSGQLPPPSAAPIQLSAPPSQPQNPFSRPIENGRQMFHPVPPLAQNRPNTGQLPPIRKTARMINPKREAEPLTPEIMKRQKAETRPAQNSSQDTFDHITTLIRGCEAAKAARSIPVGFGEPAFRRLEHLVREWRRYTKSSPVEWAGLNLINAAAETFHGYPELHIFLMRLFKKNLAQEFEGVIASSTAQHPPQDPMDRMLGMLRWDETRRDELCDFLREGKCWTTICRGYDGLLCLLAPDTKFFDLAVFKDRLGRFHAELDTDFVRSLCTAGSIFERSIWDHLELPEFLWETTSTAWLQEEKLALLLDPFRLIKSNYYNQRFGHCWSRPAGWHWQWPTDPTLVFPGDQPCELCSTRKICRCIETRVPRIPRISEDGSKGLGIRSVGPHRANDILGELVGELVPPGSFPDEWTLELRRPDLDDQPVADIYPLRMGNWVRKVNHSTEPSAAFRVMKISGRWRQMLVAVRDIGDGQEITAKYGKGFLRGQPYSVVEGLY